MAVSSRLEASIEEKKEAVREVHDLQMQLDGAFEENANLKTKLKSEADEKAALLDGPTADSHWENLVEVIRAAATLRFAMASARSRLAVTSDALACCRCAMASFNITRTDSAGSASSCSFSRCAC